MGSIVASLRRIRVPRPGTVADGASLGAASIHRNLSGPSQAPFSAFAHRGTSQTHDQQNRSDQSMFSGRLTKPIAIGATAIAVGGGAYGIVSATARTGSGAAATATSASATSGQPVSRGAGSNARSGPAAGGSSGTVDGVSTSSFTITTPAGQNVTVKKVSSTTYRNGTSSRSASSITKGESVLVLGITNGTTITAGQGIVQPTDASGSTTASQVVPFQRGAQSTSKQVGQILRATSRGRARSLAERRRITRLKLRWPPTPGASSTVL